MTAYIGNGRSQHAHMDNTYTDEEIERCTLSNRREIVFLLRGLIKRGDRVSVIFQEGRQSFLTVLIDVSAEDGFLYFDVSGSPEINQAFLKAEHSTFTTVVEGIRIQFSTKKCRETTLRGERVFAASLPQSMLRLQRREFFRLQLPTVKPFVCRIRRGTPGEKTLPIHDISVGGIGIVSPHPLDYEQMELLENSWVDLAETGVLAVTLEVRYISEIANRTGRPHWHLGCKFVALSPLNETIIQRFMAKIEAERRALSAG
jgi:c-di-GMP-binding flagellar brake protein YcgR